jgi:excisionase family DNA binding protein
VLAVSTATILKLVREERIPVAKVGDAFRFDIEAVKAALTVKAAVLHGACGARPRRRNHRWLFAVHEAAHAVIARVQGIAVVRTTIALDGGCRGLTITAGPSPEEPDINIGPRGRSSWEKHLRTMLAAAIAEQAFAGEPIRGIFAKPGKTFVDDADNATLFAFGLYVGISREVTPARLRLVCERLLRLQEQTRRLVERHRSKIERVARALLERRRLQGAEISSLLAEAA